MDIRTRRKNVDMYINSQIKTFPISSRSTKDLGTELEQVPETQDLNLDTVLEQEESRGTGDHHAPEEKPTTRNDELPDLLQLRRRDQSKRTSIERRESDIISHGGGEINRQWERKINRRKRTGR
ncbi:hypothetical protein F2Q70_00013431 [Brassica cretica]|uniref:Uncharacterized protein n=1 Tax=Brassica cretica TaxID=69181 RepID=A0A8S9M477_BRACR|nr:hypothetical protein F2Q70_00013431 [Brassica cretica]